VLAVAGLIGEGEFIHRGEGDRVKQSTVDDFHHAMQSLRDEAERWVYRQRYKGRGEMNPEQLCENTMDSTVRRLSKTSDEIELRRNFKSNALRAGNIDVQLININIFHSI
jgi:DNA gyrase subunit B